ncbi:hypothetical protein NDU88_008897, partial [Pleurodeles waltl]
PGFVLACLALLLTALSLHSAQFCVCLLPASLSFSLCSPCAQSSFGHACCPSFSPHCFVAFSLVLCTTTLPPSHCLLLELNSILCVPDSPSFALHCPCAQPHFVHACCLHFPISHCFSLCSAQFCACLPPPPLHCFVRYSARFCA